jgi:hypothetical protein
LSDLPHAIGHQYDQADSHSVCCERPSTRIGGEARDRASRRRSEQSDRLPAEDLDLVTAENVWSALEKFRDPGLEHPFGPSTDFDLVTDDGERFPPKAVFGLAASEALGFMVQPKHFSSGTGSPCFRVLQRAGFTIVPKNEAVPETSIPSSREDPRVGRREARTCGSSEKGAGVGLGASQER